MGTVFKLGVVLPFVVIGSILAFVQLHFLWIIQLCFVLSFFIVGYLWLLELSRPVGTVFELSFILPILIIGIILSVFVLFLVWVVVKLCLCGSIPIFSICFQLVVDSGLPSLFLGVVLRSCLPIDLSRAIVFLLRPGISLRKLLGGSSSVDSSIPRMLVHMLRQEGQPDERGALRQPGSLQLHLPHLLPS